MAHLISVNTSSGKYWPKRHTSLFRVVLLCLLLIVLFQVFYYLKDFPVLYYSSKVVIPILLIFFYLLFALAFHDKSRVPLDGLLVLLVGIYLILISALSSYFTFGQPVYLGIAWQIKIVPLFLYFPVFFLLRNNWCDISDFYRASIILSLIAITSYIFINSVFDPANYWNENSFFFANDSKGFRFRFPDIPVLLGLFIFFWRWRQGGRFIDPFLFICFGIYFIFIHEQRLLLICIMLLIFYHLIRESKTSIKLLIIAAAPVGIFLIFSTEMFSSLISGGDASVVSRRITANIIISEFIKSPANVFFGFGNLSTYFNDGFESLYGPHFWLTDVGWLGLLYEYGLFGVILIVILMFRMVQHAGRLAKLRSPFFNAMRDLVWVILLISIIAPWIIYYSGVTATLLAIFSFADHRLKKYRSFT